MCQCVQCALRKKECIYSAYSRKRMRRSSAPAPPQKRVKIATGKVGSYGLDKNDKDPILKQPSSEDIKFKGQVKGPSLFRSNIRPAILSKSHHPQNT